MLVIFWKAKQKNQKQKTQQKKQLLKKQKIQNFVFEHDDTATDMYNSAAGKYGDEAKDLLGRSYNRISQLFYEEEY